MGSFTTIKGRILATGVLPGLVAMLVFATSGNGFAEPSQHTVTVTSPSAGSTWYKGDERTITWTSSLPGEGSTRPTSVRIVLRTAASDAVVRVIANPVANGGFHKWMVPAELPDGSYRVRVRFNGSLNGLWDDSEPFQIRSKALTVTKPSAGEVWPRGEERTITWTKQGTMGNSVRIYLEKTDSDVFHWAVAEAVANTGSFLWTIPGDLADGTYRVYVQVIGPDAPWDGSDAFRIGNRAPLGMSPGVKTARGALAPLPPPKLVVKSLRTNPERPVTGELFEVYIEFFNEGEGPTGPGQKYMLVVMQPGGNPLWNPGPHAVDGIVQPGSSSVTIQKGVIAEPGTYTFFARPDPGGFENAAAKEVTVGAKMGLDRVPGGMRKKQ